MTQTEGTATVSSAERFAGARRREREAARAAVRVSGADACSSWPSRSGGTSSPPSGPAAPNSSNDSNVAVACWSKGTACSTTAVAAWSNGSAASKTAVAGWSKESAGSKAAVAWRPNGSSADALSCARPSCCSCAPVPAPPFHCVASYTPLSKVWVPHAHCWVAPAPSDCSACCHACAFHCPVASGAEPWAGMPFRGW